MMKRTPLYECHLTASAKMIDFFGWEMPLHYGSQLQEHHTVRQQAGVFDVSHMTIIDCQGSKATAYLRWMLANNVDRLIPGKALYTCMLNEKGGIIDDLIVYKITEDSYRLVVNSATREKDLSWLQQHRADDAIILQERTDLAMVAIQGAQIRKKMSLLFSDSDAQAILNLKPFFAVILKDFFIARTGYTGEDGFEIILPAKKAPSFWGKIVSAGIQPCGLGARDTLRLEAGLNLYGADMDEEVSPLESNLAWTVALEPKDRQFIGRDALEQQVVKGISQKLVGLILEGPGVLRHHQKIIINNTIVGEITSGSFSPSLQKGIALARVPATIGSQCLVEIRGKQVPAHVIKPPFVQAIRH